MFGIRDALLDQIKTRTGKWRTAFVIGGFPLAVERERLCGILRAKPIYIESTLAECLSRCKNERPAEWERFVLDWWESYTA